MKQYADQKGDTHYTTEYIGADALGQWYRTKNSSLLLLDAAEGIDTADAFENVKVLPLQNMPEIVLPVDLLNEPHEGLLYRIPDKVIPLTAMMHTGGKDAKEVLLETGGMKKRVDILIQLSLILMKLHSIPAMYGSFSPERIWVTEKGLPVQTYLLYSGFMSGSMFFKSLPAYDKYTAEEFKQGRGSIASDVYSFAELAKDFLTFSGEINGPLAALTALFDQVLQEAAPEKRMDIFLLHRELIKIKDKIIACKHCKQDFVYSGTPCPYCNGPLSKMLKGEVYDKVLNQVRPLYTKIFDFVLDQQYFYDYHTSVTKPGEMPRPTIGFKLHVSQDKRLNLTLKNLMEQTIIIQETKLEKDKEYKITLPSPKIPIQIPQYSQTVRCIDIEIL